jgi:hypothetical protein
VPAEPPKVIEVAESVPSSFSLSVLPAPVASLSEALLVIFPERSSVPPEAVIVAVQPVAPVIVPVTVPTPVMPPLDERVVPFATVSVVDDPEIVRVSVPLSVSDLMLVLRLSVGDLAVEPIKTSSPLFGTRLGLPVQLPTMFQSVLVLPVQVCTGI